MASEDNKHAMAPKTIGVLGAGQLGRMLALAGYPLGQSFAFLGDTPEAPAAKLGAFFDSSCDPNAWQALATECDVITFESENTQVDWVKQMAKTTPVFPGPESLYVCQDRAREKALFTDLGIACAPYQVVDSLEALRQGVRALGLPAILKTAQEGYDGKGQWVIKTESEIDQAWSDLYTHATHKVFVLEQWVPFKRELSLVAVRSAQGAHVYYPLVENHHRDGILRYTLAPAPELEAQLQSQAEAMMQSLMDALDHVGVLALELFETDNGLVANEMAPRVHNSGHWSMDVAETSQFENHIRALSGLPLGATQMRAPAAAMINVIGALPDLTPVWSMAQTKVHLYDKAARPGRKLGHINLWADSAAQRQSKLDQLRAVWS